MWTALAEPEGTGAWAPRAPPAPPPRSSSQDGRKKRISDEHRASSGKLNKVFVRKRGVPKAGHLTSGWAVKGLANSQRCRQKTRGGGGGGLS